MQSGFEYASSPQSVGVKRSKYREPQSTTPNRTENIMYDRRVVRGSTCSKPRDKGNHSDLNGSKKKNLSKRNPNYNKNVIQSPTTYDEDNLNPLPGRKHMEIQTETYLEELTDRVPEATVETQTEAFLDRPPLPVFKPRPSGVDASTSIEEGDLFNFDLEVEPILEVLVGKSLEIGMMEVLEEEEMAEIFAHQQSFAQARDAERADLQRLEASARRHAEEKERRLLEASQAIEDQTQLSEKVAARAIAGHCLRDLRTNVFGNLLESGHFYDPLERHIGSIFLPSMIQNASAQVEEIAQAQNLLNSILSNVLSNMSSSTA